jgi:hypothetical protein
MLMEDGFEKWMAVGKAERWKKTVSVQRKVQLGGF